MTICIIESANKVGYTVDGNLVRLNGYGTAKPTGYDTLTAALFQSMRETTIAAIGLGLAIAGKRVSDSVASVEYITGSRISEGYRTMRPGSCMRNKAHLHSIYKENPNDVGLFTFKLANGIFGSLLCWTGKRGIYIDRLYSSSKATPILSTSGNDKALIVAAILGYFAEKLPGIPVYSIRASDRLPGIPMLPSDKRVSFRLSLANNDSDEVGLPYCDTLCFARRIDNDTIILSNTAYGKYEWVQANSVDGTTLDDTEVGVLCCCSCSGAVDQYDRMEYHNDIYCEDCYYNSFTHCEYYEEDYPSDEVSEYTVYWGRRGVQSVYLCDDALASRFTEAAMDSCVEYVHDDERIEDYDGNYYCPDDIDNGTIVELVDGSYMLASEAYYSEKDGNYYASEDDSDDSDDDSDDVATPTPTPTDLAIADSVTVGGILVVSRYDRRADEVGATYKVFHVTSGYILTAHSGSNKASAVDYANRFMEYLTLCETASAMIGAPIDILGAFLAWNDNYLTFHTSFPYFNILSKAHKYALHNSATAIDYSTLAS